MKKNIKFAENLENIDEDNEQNISSRWNRSNLDPKRPSIVGSIVGASQSQIVVEIRVVFLKLGNISIKDNKFTCDAFMEACWYDPRFDTSQTQVYDDKIHWNPRIYIQNITANHNQEIWYHVEKTRLGTKVAERRRLKGEFTQSFDLKNFPFDIQELSLSISTFRSSQEVNLILSKEKVSSVNLSTFTQTHEWVLHPAVSNTENVRQSFYSDQRHRNLDISVHISRKPTYHYWNTFLLILIITLISYCCYSIRCDISSNRMIISITVFLTLITFKLAINKYLPSLSYLTSVDQFSLTNILILFLNCAYYAIMGVLTPEFCPAPYRQIDNYMFYVSIGVFAFFNSMQIIGFLVLVFKNKKELQKKFNNYNLNSSGKRMRIKSIFKSDVNYDINED